MQLQTLFFQPVWICLTLAFFSIGCRSKPARLELLAVKTFDNYPSGSGLAYYKGQVYIIGDDANRLVLTNLRLEIKDSIKLFETSVTRIPKESKPDFESIAVVKQGALQGLLLTGSGSLAPYRNSCRLVNPVTKEAKSYQLDTFYQRLKNQGITDLNVEGAASTPFGMILASRGNKSFRKNFLIICPHRFWENQSIGEIKMIKTGASDDTTVFLGVSGLDYVAKSDQLLLTVSTENTYTSYDDGGIGKSYLWIINDISSKRKLAAINPDRIIDLEQVDARFKGQKIESVCIVEGDKKLKQVVLVADDDKGHTTLFSMTFE